MVKSMNETETAIHGRWSLKIDSRKRYTLIKNWFKKAIYFNQNGITILLPVEIIEGSLWSWKDFIRWLQTRVSTVGQCYRRTSWNVSNQQWWWYIIPRRKPDSYHISILHSRELSTDCCTKHKLGNKKCFLSLTTYIRQYVRQSDNFIAICLS